MAEKSKRELKKAQKIKEENIKKLQEEVNQSKKIPKEYRKKINKKVLLNIAILFAMILYLTCINIMSLYLDTEVYIKYIKVLSIILCVISIVYFEISYKKDNEGIFLYGVEILILAFVTLFSNYAYFLYFDKYNKMLIGISIIIAIYFAIKIIYIKTKMKKAYYKQLNDIKDIVKKD